MLGVKHECEIGTEHHKIYFLPNRGLFRKACDTIHLLLMASDKHPSARKYLRSYVSIISERRHHLRNHRHIIHPLSIFRFYWEFIMIATIICLLISVPYQAAFRMNERSIYWTVFKNVLLFLCCVDIMFNFMSGYFDKTQQIVVMKPRKIIKEYLRRSFLLDLIGSLPTDVAFVTVWQEYVVARELASLTCGFRVFSLNSYISMYWIIPVVTTSLYLPKYPHYDTWLHSFNLWEESENQRHMYCILRAVPIFFSVDTVFSDTKPKTETDLTSLVIFQLAGGLLMWILIARVRQFHRTCNSSKLKYRDMMAYLNECMRHRQLPHQTRRRIAIYYEYYFVERYFRELEILSSLPVQMRQEINMQSCRKLVENVTFFKNLPLALLARIVAFLKLEIFLANDIIVSANQPGDCMYFISTGTVAIYTSTGREVCHLEDGAHFGEIVLVMPAQRRTAFVVAVETCELYRLDRIDFTRTIHPYPLLWDQIKKIAIERHERTMILASQ
ncbi:potassium/sodium hyperpolarization-activated cyclic nucleotide-gated channel 2-like isoform X2 [Pseudomyrmex gracilis]|uniref:potassium/sodium hyperpolarization-activated cyclic nucleotide-gated channel 2-like isoform X2 n=1 Tax=Pseudomyrmex gracilis TaxID=219809 RepID=UPI000995454C|nr:potassium/sodium hyperpolarization-activated cyclic nucleotide-gated channel 2-like isoform X2 [Pseudomyrmex gracilis]